MTNPLLSLQNVTKNFGGLTATSDVSLELSRGELHAVIGPNGAGKSTLFALIAGQLRPDKGRILLQGKDITMIPGHRRIGLGISRAFQVARIFTDLSVEGNLQVAVNAHLGRNKNFISRNSTPKVNQLVSEILESVSLNAQKMIVAGTLSQGDRKRLEIAMALSLEPQLLLLDEPTAGMSPEETNSTVKLIRELGAEKGTTILITEHDMAVVFGLASRITVLNMGSVLCTGNAEEIRSRPDVREIYLGHGVLPTKGGSRDE